MGDVARAGRTVVLVSHNMAAINALCSRCSHGQRRHRVRRSDEEATPRYYAESLNMRKAVQTFSARREKATAKPASLHFRPAARFQGRPLDTAYPGCDLSIDVEMSASEASRLHSGD